VSKEVANQLKDIKGIKGVLTRKTDVFIPLDERAKKGIEVNADLFISIHCNAAADSRAYGAETFVLGIHRNEDNFEIAKKENKVILMEDDYEVKYDGFDPKSPESYMTFTMMQEEYLDESILLADKVQKRFTNSLNRYNRGVKQAGFLVLRETTMPSVLIELGFLSNPKEGKFLNSKRGQQKMANAVVKAIKAYKESVQSTSVQEKKNQQAEDVVQVNQTDKTGYTFKVQLAASSNEIAPNSKNFNGLIPISKGKEGGYYKYYYGHENNYNSAKQLVEKAQSKGYKTAFVVAFKANGEKISVTKAIDSTKD
jgi:N-acetylmuramoyl-L-alanine amidase